MGMRGRPVVVPVGGVVDVGAVVVPGVVLVGAPVDVGCPPRKGGSGMPVGSWVGKVKGPEPNGFGMVAVGAEFVAVPDGGVVAVPDGGGLGVVAGVCG